MMSTPLFQPRPALLAAVLTVAMASSGHAADTDIYRSINNVNPNLLMILDTSSSMDGVVIRSQYNYTRSYDGACRPDRVYFADDESATPPACDDDVANYFDKDRVSCFQGLDDIDGPSGFYVDHWMAWDPDNGSGAWEDGDASGNHLYYECADDWGIHGLVAGDPSVWPEDGADGPFRSTDPGTSNIWESRPGLIVYSANFLNWYHGADGDGFVTSTRMETVQDVTRGLLSALGNINVGLMRFNRDAGGPVLYPVGDIDSGSNRSDLIAEVDALTANGFTPITETLYEAMRYLRGQSVVWGTAEHGDGSHPDSLVNGTGSYLSPITEECQKNHVLLLSDGEPTDDDGSDAAINALIQAAGLGDPTCAHGDAFQSIGTQSCLDDLAELMFRTDNSPLPGSQPVSTYTVGFHNDSPLLSQAGSSRTGGSYFTANSETQLQASFQRILEDIFGRNSTFTSANYSANLFNRMSHDSGLYFAMFLPSGTARWEGNIKKYQFGFITDASGNPVDQDGDGVDDVGILDASGAPAVLSNGEFRDEARSLFTHASISADGNDPTVGGLASRLMDYDEGSGGHDAASRASRVYTYTQSGSESPVTDLTDSVNRLHEDNALVTADLLVTGEQGVPTDSQRRSMLQWIRGVDTQDEDGDGSISDGNARLGAPLHSSPVVVTYQNLRVDGESVQRDIVFATTNDGVLHAFDTSPTDANAGMELWAYVPPESLRNLKTVHDNAAAADIEYGLDGGADVWVHDINGNGVILDDGDALEADEHVHLYFSQRRGGRSVFALDVSDPLTPHHLWTISGNDDPATPFRHLGQSWSRPRVARILDLDTSDGSPVLAPREVVIFGGGYDVEQDSRSIRTADAVGNALYMVDASTGELVWWARGPAADGPVPDYFKLDMEYSIPGDIRVLDISGDGIADRLYLVDMGGQLWRFDINNVLVDTIDNRIIGGVIADLQTDAVGDGAVAASNRRFFYPPDVAYNEPNDGSPFLSIAVGSGHRADPKGDTIADRLYVIKDRFVNGPPLLGDGAIGYTRRLAGDLLDVTDRADAGLLEGASVDNPDGLTAAQSAALDRGWYIDLEGTGEKALATALTAGGNVFFTTYTPSPPVNDNEACGSDGIGESQVYAMSVIDGRPVANLDGSGSASNLVKSDRSMTLQRSGLAAGVSIIFPDLAGVTPKILVGTEIVPVEIDNSVVRTYWYQDTDIDYPSPES